MINRAVLVGHLTRNPELRYTSSGTAVATFTVAEVVVDNFSLLESKAEADKRREENDRYSQHQTGSNTTTADSEANSSAATSTGSTNQNDPFINNGDQIDISDDDLPF